jgi:phage regulator Rha-like protein
MEVIKSIQNRIYEIGGRRVMLDFDLAELYKTETKYLKRAVKANINRFPADFMFELTKDEFLRCNFSTSKRGGTRYMPYAFTEHGVTMLASVLNSEKAIEMNIAIVRAFIALRSMTIHNHEILNQLMELRDRIGEHDIQLSAIYDALENLLDKKQNEQEEKEKWVKRQRIGFKK